jgi:hypothetical protein
MSPVEEAVGSPYERVLGKEFRHLDPQLRTYFGRIPDGFEGVGAGRYEEAGLRLRVLRPLFSLLGRWRIAFAEHGADVPFRIRNTRSPDGVLHAERTFSFPAAERVMTDAMHVVDGRLVDRIGTGGRVEVVWEASVSQRGLTLRSRALALRVAGTRLPLPPIMKVVLHERSTLGQEGVQTVDVRVAVPLLGEVYGYRGSFTYALRPLESAGSE